MTKPRRLKCQEAKLMTQMTRRRRLRIFQILLRTWGITHTYAAPHPLKAHLIPQDHRLQLSDITREKQQSTI